MKCDHVKRPGQNEDPRAKYHDWFIEPREYERQEQRRGRRNAYDVVDPRRCALIVIDMIPFFVRDSGYCRGIVANIGQLAHVVRDAGGTVAWIVPDATQSQSAHARQFFGEETAELFSQAAGTGPIAKRLWPDLDPRDNDLFFEKSSYSAFYPGSCGLPAALADRGIDTVLVSGTLTNICCESSARDAHAAGFQVIFLADATAARRDQDHNATLHNVYRSFGDVRPTKEVIGLLSGGVAPLNSPMLPSPYVP